MDQRKNELLRYLQILKKRRYLFLAVTLVAMTLLIAYSYYIPKKYQADSTVFIESNLINNLTKGLAVTADMGDQTRVLKYALLSRDIIRKTLQEIGTRPSDEAEIQQLVASLQQDTDITTHGKDLFRVSIINTDPIFAQKYINTLVRTYVDQNQIGKRKETAGASQFLDRQLEQFKNKLEQAEDNIIAFRNSQGSVLATNEATLLSSIAEYRRQIEDVDLSIDTLETRRKQLQRDLKSVEPVITNGSEQAPLGTEQLQARLQELLLTYTENYPEVVKVRQELAALNQQRVAPRKVGSEGGAAIRSPRHQQIRQQLFEADAALRALQGKKATLSQFMRQREKELKLLPESQKRLAALNQERDSYRQIYEQMLLRSNQSEVSRQLELGDQGTTFRVVDAALLPIKPISPDMTRLILLAIVGGVCCGFGVVVFRENFDTSINSVNQLRELGVDVIAMVPGIVDDDQDRRQFRRDLLVFSTSGIYFTAVLGLLIFEFLKRMGVH